MKILMVTSEATPLAKSGGLADAVSSLSLALSRLGHDIRIVMPRYYSIDRSGLKRLPDPLGIPTGWGEAWTGVYQTSLPGSSVPVYLIEHEGLYGRDGIYGTKAEPDFADNLHRFAVLSRGAFQLCRKLGWTPDIFHAHDWPASLVPIYLKYMDGLKDFKKSASVLTIHNLGYQGTSPVRNFSCTGFGIDVLAGSGLFDGDNVNLLKGGISSADILTTVSPTYAKEIQTPEFGFRLDGLLSRRSSDLFGILNGIDEDEWNPAKDKLIPHTFSGKNLKPKAQVKRELQRQFGLPQDEKKPLFGLISRLTDQKGIGELFGPGYGSAYSLATKMDIQFVILGSGEAWCEREVMELSRKLPNLKARIGYDNKLAHLIEAGSDFFLMPSRYEPCGLNQMYSLRYGTLPIVHKTGGLADTVSNYIEATGEGSGFMFDELSPRAIFDTVGWAVSTWYDRPAHIAEMRKRGMAKDFSWKSSARKYEEAYESALEKEK